MKSFSASFLPALSHTGEHPASFVNVTNLFFAVILKCSFVKMKDN